MHRFRVLALGAVLSATLTPVSNPAMAQPSPYPPIDMPESPLFPPDNWWNVDVSGVAVDAAATTKFQTFVGLTHGMHPDFGGDVSPGSATDHDVYGFVYYTVSGSQARVPVTFPDPNYDSESDHGWPGVASGYPIPTGAQTQIHWIETGFPANETPAGPDHNGDRHMLIVDKDKRLLYEIYHARYISTGTPHWEASSIDNDGIYDPSGSGAIFPLDSNYRRPDGATSADAGGLAILPGLVRYDEAYGTQPIRHAIRVTLHGSNGYVYPASHEAGSNTSALPMGARLRLKSAVNPTISAGATQADRDAVGRIVQAMKTYGLIMADNGSDLYFSGVYDTRWDNGILNPAFSTIHASDFEVLTLGWKPAETAPSGALLFYTLPPCRIIDTRNAPGIYGAPRLTQGVAREIALTGKCTLPPDAKAVSLNLTAVTPPANGSLTAYPGNFSTAPNTTALSFSVGKTRANNSVIALSTSGTGAVNFLSSVTGLDLVVDINGYFK